MKQMTRPPGPTPAEVRSRLAEMRNDSPRFFASLAGTYGDITYWRVGSQDCFLLNDPEYVQDVLVTSHRKFLKGMGVAMLRQIFGQGLVTTEGDVHRRDRRMSNPFFHHDHVTNYASSISRYAVEARDRWEDGKVIDVDKEMMALTLRVVCKVLFDTDIEDERLFEFGRAWTSSFIVFYAPYRAPLEQVPRPEGEQFREAIATMDRTIEWLIEDHRATGDRHDFMSMLLQHRDEQGNALTVEQIRDHTITILGSGHDTTSNGLTWTLHLLSQNPDVRARLQEEVDTVLQGRAPTAADVPRLRFTEMVIKEGWRVIPPIWVVERRSIEEHEIGGYEIPVGSLLTMSQYVMSRNERYYPDPLRFDPLRWTPRAERSRPKWSYFPFGGGPRVCLGESFALMESILVLAGLTQRWELDLVPGHPVDMQAAISVRPRYGMKMTARRRQPAAA